MANASREAIRAVADPLIAAGATVEQVRLAVWHELHVMIGEGGHGATLDGQRVGLDEWPECGYCGGWGGGGHGGYCPAPRR